MTDAEIAVTLGIQRRTVTTHMHNILTKSGLRSRVELKNLGGLGA
ncbi:MAG: LuxR C-terminal-related transcriptional regulator [Dehalococcoidia bacterium]|nr:LuxR C-terminal-related transcriptional regulator [Dehalococcoidia bacterium]